MDLRALLPPSIKWPLRRLYDGAEHALEGLLGRRDRYTPPRRLRLHVGPWQDPREYVRFRRLFFERLQQLCPVRDSDVVLDIGCGAGLHAVSFANHLRGTGRYRGFDVAPAVIDWCQKRIAPRHPNCEFRVVDIYNAEYNPAGRQRGEEFEFPYPEAEFDFALAGSVFTHLRPAVAQRYLEQTARVLKPGGRSAFSFFLINAETEAAVRAGASTLAFQPVDALHWVVDPEVPERAIAFPEEWLRQAYQRAGLSISHIERGSWPAAIDKLRYQDVVMAHRS